MELKNYQKSELFETLKTRINDFERRERIVISMPYNCKVNRVELYMGETFTDKSYCPIYGQTFKAKVTLSIFADSSNKAVKVLSFTYKNEFFDILDDYLDKLYSLIN